MKDQIQTLIDELLNGVDDEMLEQYENGKLKYWDSGSLSDAFEMGGAVGDCLKALEIAARLKQIINN